MYVLLKLIPLSLLLISFSSSKSVNNDEASIAQYMSEASNRLTRFEARISEISKISSSLLTLEVAIEAIQIKHEADTLDAEMRARIRETDPNSVENTQLKRQLKLLNTSTDALSEANRMEFQKTISQLEDLPSSEILCRYQDQDDCQMAYSTDVRNIFINSSDPNELQFYWEQWRNKSSDGGKKGFVEFVQLARNASALMGREVLEDWYWSYDDPNFILQLDTVIGKLKPIYSELHAHVRHGLRKKYGEQFISERGSIPQHFLEQVVLQAWKENSVLDKPYPEKSFPNLKAALTHGGYDSRKISLAAAAFFESLGMEPLESEFWSNYHAEKDFFETHGDFARIQYLSKSKHLPYQLHGEACPGFTKALGKAAILSVSTPKHLQAINLLPENDSDAEMNVNRLFELGIQTLLTIPLHYVNEKFITGALTGDITAENYNSAYWKLMEEYAGIKPPSLRTKTNFDVSPDFYNELNKNTQTSKVFSEILGYQFYSNLCTISDQYNGRNSLSPLQNCDFNGNRLAGNAMSEMMSLGSKKPWKEIIKPLTGEDHLNADDLLEYYQPLYIWLKNQNEQANTPVGWIR